MSKLNPLEPSNRGNSMPGLSPAFENEGIDPSEFIYRIGKFTIGGEDDDTLQMEHLLSRSLDGSVLIIERKDAISSVTGAYTCVIIYLEKRLNA